MTSTFYCGSTNAGSFPDLGVTLLWNNFLEESTESSTNITISWSAGPNVDQIGAWCTRVFVPAATTWTTGTYTVEVNVTTGSLNTLGKVRLHRIDQSDGTSLENSGYGSNFSCRATGVKTTTFSSLSWTSPGLTDRLCVEAFFWKTDTAARTIKIGTGTTNEEVVTPITVGTVLRPTAVAAPVASPQPTQTLALELAPSPVGSSVVGTALASLTLALSLAPSATALPVVAPDPTLTLPISLAVDPASAPVVAPDPTVDLAYNLAPDVAQAAVQAASPSVTHALSLLPTPGVAVAAAADPTLGMALNVLPDPVAAILAAADPTLGLAYSLAVDPAAAPVVAPDPTADLALSISPDAVAAVASSPDPTLTLALSLSPDAVAAVVTDAAPTLSLALSLLLDPSTTTATAPSVTLDLGGAAALGIYESTTNALAEYFKDQVATPQSIETLYDSDPTAQPDPATSWALFSVEWGRESQKTTGSGRENRLHGELLVTVHVPHETGLGSAMDLADAFATAFRLVDIGTMSARTEVPTVTSRGSTGTWWTVDLSVPFRVDHTVAV